MLQTARVGLFSVGFLFVALASGCGEEGGGGAGGDGEGGASASSTTGSGATSGNGPSGNGSSTGNGSAAVGSTVTVGPGTAASSTAGVGGGGAEACEGVDPNSVYAQTAVDFLSGATVNLCNFQGQVLMIVNIASQCGYTYQMADLQYLDETFGAEGFHVLGFLSNDFSNQGGTQEEIEACNAEHNISFQEYDIAPVTTGAQPVFAWLQSQADPGPAAGLVPSWNFNKYVISKDGSLVGHYSEDEEWGTDSSAPTFDASLAVQKVREQLAL